jgi:putative glutathione S-transferase
VRFDAVYHGHFKCNLRRLIDYPNLWAYTKRPYALARETTTLRLGTAGTVAAVLWTRRR